MLLLPVRFWRRSTISGLDFVVKSQHRLRDHDSDSDDDDDDEGGFVHQDKWQGFRKL